MAAMSGGSTGISYSCMRQPSLIDQLKNILEEYPDGGQILKELFQNAEDAGASYVHIIFDQRTIDKRDQSKPHNFSRFFTSPALCVYNDAVFTEKDWEGIQMIYKSIKEEDRLTVGRFGLGFKSVFHITGTVQSTLDWLKPVFTDYPCVISGTKVLMIDPSQPLDKVNAMVELSNIENLREAGLSPEAFWDAFEGIFGLTKNCVKKGSFKGTIFRFPLRKVASELSGTIYSEEKITNLFDVFNLEAPTILLFLKSLERITVSSVYTRNRMNKISEVQIVDKTGNALVERKDFSRKIISTPRDYDGPDIVSSFEFSIETFNGKQSTVLNWLVVNYFVGESASPCFQALIRDQNLSYSPFVGVATQLGKECQDFQGHVFCFLPLPKEGYSLTGLPVHVNGFFALDHSRHHIKWQTDEQQGKRIEDRSVLWNKCLIKEAVPRAYENLITRVILRSNKERNTQRTLHDVYTCLAQPRNTKKLWEELEQELYKRMKNSKFLYSETTKRWMQPDDACLATFADLPKQILSVKQSIVKCLSSIEKVFVSVSADVFGSLKHYYPHLQDLSPSILSKFMSAHRGYKKLQSSEKLDILAYLLSADDGDNVPGLELLLLESGKWVTFSKDEEAVFACSEETIKLFPGLKRKFISVKILKYAEQLSMQGKTQIRSLTTNDFVGMLRETLDMEFGNRNKRQIDSSSRLSVHWLKDVWKYMLAEDIISECTDLTIVPVLKSGSWSAPKTILLKSVRENLLVKGSRDQMIPHRICRCLELLGASIIDSLPDWIPRKKVKSYFTWPSDKSILAFLSKMASRVKECNSVGVFNAQSDDKDKEAFAGYLAACAHLIDDSHIQLMRQLALFRELSRKSDRGAYVSVYDTPKFICDKVNFSSNISYPFPLLDVEKSQEMFVTRIGGQKISLEQLILCFLQQSCSGSCVQGQYIMDYVIENFHLFRHNDSIVAACRKVSFLKADNKSDSRYKASDLFDPTDPTLQTLLYDEALMPLFTRKMLSSQVAVLKDFGLKGREDVDAKVMLKVASTLSLLSQQEVYNKRVHEKAATFVSFLKLKPEILSHVVENRQTLSTCLKPLNCIPVCQTRPLFYPKCLDWFQYSAHLCKPCEVLEECLCLLVGSQMPVATCDSEELNTVFSWKREPPIGTVLGHLEVVKKQYTIHNRSELMPVAKVLYEHIGTREKDLNVIKEDFQNKKLVLTDEGFMEAKCVIISKWSESLDLRPYFYFLPQEFETMTNMFETVGCKDCLDVSVLLEALQKIKNVHIQEQRQNIVSRDRKIVYSILVALVEAVDVGDIDFSQDSILMMVHDANPNTLKLLPVSLCTYDDDPGSYFEKAENVYLVHEMIPSGIAEALGVKSITRKSALDMEELSCEQWGQKEPLTTRINRLLRYGYTDGLSVPKELIQNADDAGASVVKFLWDERENVDCRGRVLSKKLRSFQGPALWVYNDAKFTKQDLENVIRLNAGTKQNDVQKIGKFGLGFCSVYNLTDLPSFVTGRSVVIFDPHETHLSNILRKGGSGIKYTLPNKTLTSRYVDQFKPYQRIFGCNILDSDFEEYDGTLFRLPLRTELQAQESQICQVSYTEEEMNKLLVMFIGSAANCLLFLQNVERLEVYHLSKDAIDASSPTLLFSVKKESFIYDKGSFISLTKSVLSKIPCALKAKDNLLEIHKTRVLQKFEPAIKLILPSLRGIEPESISTWLLSWATGQYASLQSNEQLSTESSVPLGAVACLLENECTSKPIALCRSPVGFYRDGHLFCFLPLPVKTNLELHLNGCFSLTTSRRQLLTVTEDDKDGKRGVWNRVLMEDAVVKSAVNLLETVSDFGTDENYTYHSLWPKQCSEVVFPFKTAFYRHIITHDSRVFKCRTGWLRFGEVFFLDPALSQSELGNVASLFMSRIKVRSGLSLIEMPENILKEIRECNANIRQYIDQALLTENEFLKIFIENIQDEFWKNRSEDRNTLILRALNSKSKTIMEVMCKTACIPTEPQQILKVPEELIHPLKEISLLFDVKDERFPIDTQGFRSCDTLSKMVDLGMHSDYISLELLLDRCKTVSKLAETCSVCAKERCANLIAYMSQEKVLVQLKSDQVCVATIRKQPIIPVLTKPTSWKFTWKGDDLSDSSASGSTQKCDRDHKSNERIFFRKSEHQVTVTLMDYCGMVRYVVEDDIFEKARARKRPVERLLKNLMITYSICEVQTSILINQLSLLVDQYSNKSKQFKEMNRIHEKLLTVFEKRIGSDDWAEDKRQIMEVTEELAMFLVGDDLVQKDRVALNVKEEIKPFMYKMSAVEKIHKETIYRHLGVKDAFSISDILSLMQILRDTWDGNLEKNVAKIGALLINLESTLSESNLNYYQISEHHDFIYAPDTNCELYPTYQLCLENDELDFGVDLKVLHPSIAPFLGSRIGVKAKETRCFEKISVGIPFGQREDLIKRIQGLLKAYPCDSGIVKELLQNADDAGATEIHFVKDYRNHSCKRLFSDKCRPLQGPSVLVYNNSFFTKKDIEGIHNLGQGSKSQDPTKTGQYGVGFNAVYHLTDTPSFITVGPDDDIKGHLIIFDPLCKHVPKANKLEPGQMCSIEDVQRNFPDQLEGFSYNQILNGKSGTLFRFPLRQTMSPISETVIDSDTIDSLLLESQEVMSESLLFLKNVTKIKISNITSGSLVEEFSVWSEIPESGRQSKREFQEKVAVIAAKNRNKVADNFKEDPFDVVFPLKTQSSFGHVQEWVIVNRFGMQIKNSNLTLAINNGDLGLLPIGGVALPKRWNLTERYKPLTHTSAIGRAFQSVCSVFQKTETSERTVKCSDDFRGKCFCFLPLPIFTGLPVHLNAHFALDHEARRELWKDGFRKEWNMKLIEYIVIPCWISGLLFIQKEFKNAIDSSNSWKRVQIYLDKYHQLFPVCSSTTSLFWTHAVKHFYVYVVKMHKTALFPSVLDKKNETFLERLDTGALYSVTWNKLCGIENDVSNGVFNVVWNCLKHMTDEIYRRERSQQLKVLLKQIGMKLIETPLFILSEIQDCQLNCAKSTPETVFCFLTTWKSSDERLCHVDSVGLPVEKTTFKSAKVLCMFLQYLSLDENYPQKLEGLPLLLTQDGLLRVYSRDYPVFRSHYHQLLPSSSSKFLHDTVCIVLNDERLYQLGILKKFGYKDFLELLPFSVLPAIFRTGSEIARGVDGKYESISVKWLVLLYDFIGFCTPVTGTCIDTLQLQENLDMICLWSFLPVVSKNGVRSLLPLKERAHVMEWESASRFDSLGQSLLKLNIPELDSELLKKCSQTVRIKHAMRQCVASLSFPETLLDCLVYQKQQQNCVYETLSTDDATEILAYFSRNLEPMKKKIREDFIVKQLRQLPLYTTLQMSLTSIDTDGNVFVLPNGLPTCGIETWARRTQTLLLQESHSLQSLYSFLTLPNLDVENFYGVKLLHTIKQMPREHWFSHIKFLQTKLGHLLSFSYVQKKIIQTLKTIAFIEINGTFKRVDQLYDPENDVFACMLSYSDFPPTEKFDASWKRFFVHLGLVCDVDDSHMLRFAVELQNAATFGLDDALKNKANTLLACFLHNRGMKWKDDTLHKIASVRFLMPYIVPKTECNIVPQKDFAKRLIHFRGSVSSSSYKLCWSCNDVIPEEICRCLESRVHKLLGIQKVPELERVILHCQNVVDNLKENMQKMKYDKELIRNQMTCFYQHFQNSHQYMLLIKSRLQHKPVIHLPDEEDFVSVDEIVIDLQTNLEIKPYLYRAPKVYGQFHDLFENLGSKTDIKFIHYANILQKISSGSGDNELTLPERIVVRQCLLGLLAVKINKDDSMSSVKRLYLPNKKLILKDSSTIVFSDDPWLRYRMETNNANFDFFVDLSFLKLSDSSSLETIFRFLPENLRPKMLSDLVNEKVCVGEINIRSIKAKVIENFLHSEEFITCVCRLLKHQASKGIGKFCRDKDKDIITGVLRSVRLFETSSLTTILTLKGQDIQGSDRNIKSHITRQEQGITLYFKDTSESDDFDLTVVQDDLIGIMRICFSELNTDSIKHLISLLRYVENPEQMSLVLDELRIIPYEFSGDQQRDYFPKPGTRVEENMIPFLEPGITRFREHEFDQVAMEIDDYSTGNHTEPLQVFIYVKILREISDETVTCDLQRMYEVRTGNPDFLSEAVPIYRLYRFIRRQSEPGQDLQKYDDDPVESRPFDENCRRILSSLKEAWRLAPEDRKRVARRLMLRWHPDRNRYNEEYCKQVFQYVTVVISRLENDEDIVEDVHEELSRGPSQFPRGTSAFYENIYIRAQKIAKAFYENYDRYNRAEGTGPYSHSHALNAKVRDPGEADRWLRQAKNDFKAASVMLPVVSDVEGFNWVCYTCHQACEKALKALMYARDANNVPRGSRSHSLLTLATDDDTREQARLFESRLGDQARMRYPDTLSRPQIPSDMFKKNDAEEALKIAHRMIKLVEMKLDDA